MTNKYPHSAPALTIWLIVVLILVIFLAAMTTKEVRKIANKEALANDATTIAMDAQKWALHEISMHNAVYGNPTMWKDISFRELGYQIGERGLSVGLAGTDEYETVNGICSMGVDSGVLSIKCENASFNNSVSTAVNGILDDITVIRNF